MIIRVLRNIALASGVVMTTIAACTKPQLSWAEFAMIVGTGLTVYGFSTINFRKENDYEQESNADEENPALSGNAQEGSYLV